MVGDKVVGQITSATAVPGEDRVVALAMVRREVEPPTDVTVRWPDEVEASSSAVEALAGYGIVTTKRAPPLERLAASVAAHRGGELAHDREADPGADRTAGAPRAV